MNPEIRSLTRDVLTDLSVEELEERLEMQMIRVPSAQDWCAGVDCNPDCPCNGSPCYQYCGADCSSKCFCVTWCVIDCTTLCLLDNSKCPDLMYA